eukprot:4867892-Pyramimonas_sp.AAC.1
MIQDSSKVAQDGPDIYSFKAHQWPKMAPIFPKFEGGPRRPQDGATETSFKCTACDIPGSFIFSAIVTAEMSSALGTTSTAERGVSGDRGGWEGTSEAVAVSGWLSGILSSQAIAVLGWAARILSSQAGAVSGWAAGILSSQAGAVLGWAAGILSSQAGVVSGWAAGILSQAGAVLGWATGILSSWGCESEGSGVSGPSSSIMITSTANSANSFSSSSAPEPP